MTKKTISILTALILILVSLPAGAAGVKCSVNEVFDDYAFNEQSFGSNFKVLSGLNTRIVERKGTDKALYSEMYGNAFKASFPVSELYGNTVFSYDIKIDGDVEGNILNLKGESPVFRYTNSKILLDNDRNIGNYVSGKWTTYAVAVDFESNTYDLYVDGKNIFSNRYFYSTQKNVKEIDFTFSARNDDKKCSVAIDNVRVYEGKEILPPASFEQKKRSTDVLDFEEITEKVTYDKVFLDSNGKDGISVSFTQKDDTIARWDSVPGETRPSMHFVKQGKNDVFADISLGLPDDCTKFVVECDFYPVKRENSTANICTLYSSDGRTSLLMRMYNEPNNTFLVGNMFSCGTIPVGEWSHLTAVVNLINGTCDGYVNGVLKVSNAQLVNGGVVPSKMRIGFPSTDSEGHNECYMRNYKVYEGNVIREFNDEDKETAPGLDADEFTSILTSDETVKTFLGYDTVFMSSNTKCYINKEKRDYSELSAAPFKDENGVLYVPADIISNAFSLGLESKENEAVLDGKYTLKNGEKICRGNSGSIELKNAPVKKDGIFYIPAETFCRDVLKKYVYNDERGYMLVSDTDRAYGNNRSNIWERSDDIERYMHFDRPDGSKIIEDMKKSDIYGVHPRLIATKEEFEQLKKKIQSKKEYLEIYKDFILKCENYVLQPLTKYDKPDGLRLYGALATTAGAIIKNLGMAYQLTGDKKYAERAWQEIENILSWDDWNCDNHYLDTGAAVPMITGGYDCIYDYLTAERKELFKKRFQELYLDYAVGACMGTTKFTLYNSSYTQSNWGAVCGDGMIHAAMCLIDEEDENSLLTKKCKFLASEIIQSLEFPFGQLFPAGTTSEGFVYWEYYLTDLSSATDLLMRMCNDDYGFLSSPGFDKCVDYGIYGQSDNGAWPYSDTDMDLGVYFPMTTFLYAKIANNKEMMSTLEAFKDYLGVRGNLSYLLWSGEGDRQTKINYPLDYYTEGEEITVMKSSWKDKDGIFLGALGGRNTLSLCHMDKGTFIFDALGERWFLDLGKDNYNVADGYWAEDTRRRLYRIRTEGHNCLNINPSPDEFGQEKNQTAKVIRHESADRGSIAVYDLKDVYGTKTSSYNRGFYMCDDRDAVIVQDELTLTAKSDLYWFLHTKADIEISSDGKTAAFRQNGKEVRVEFYTDLTDWKLEVMDAEPLSEQTKVVGEYARDGIRKLALVSHNASGNVTISAKIIPVTDEDTIIPLEYKPISSWSIPEGKMNKPELSALKMNGLPLDGFTPETKNYTIHLPYGSDVPYFEAESANAAVEIFQPQSLMDDCVITLTNAEGKKVKYKIKFSLEIMIKNNLSNIEPVAGESKEALELKAVSVTASDEPQKDHLAACAVDRDYKTSWTSDTDGAYIELDLGSVKEFSGLELAFLSGASRKYSYEILYSEDKQNYTRVFNGKSTGKTAETELLKIPGKARYVRLVGHFNSESNWNNLSEFHVYK